MMWVAGVRSYNCRERMEHVTRRSGAHQAHCNYVELLASAALIVITSLGPCVLR